MDGIHDPSLREVCAFHAPWEARIAGARRSPTLQLLWEELGLSILMPGPVTEGTYDVLLGESRWRCTSWGQVARSLGPVAESLPSLARLRAWGRWHSRPAASPVNRCERTAPVISLPVSLKGAHR